MRCFLSSLFVSGISNC